MFGSSSKTIYIYVHDDNDDDGLYDYVETNTGIYVNHDDTGTNPNKVDTDNDLFSDYDEIYSYYTNPNLYDTDGDSLSDYDELINYQTDPTLLILTEIILVMVLK